MAPQDYAAYDKQRRMSILDQAQADNQLPVAYWKNACQKIVPPEPINNSSLTSNKIVKAFLQQSMQIAMNDLFASGTIEGLLENTINQVTEFETQSHGAFTSESYYIIDSAKTRYHQQNAGDYAKTARASRVCHRTSSVGLLFGSIWVRVSTLRLATKSAAVGGDFQITTSFIFYPSTWLMRIGLGRGVEASLRNSKGGWKFEFNPIMAVPDDSLIFELCRDGDIMGVERLLRRRDADLRDTSSQGWTPLHVNLYAPILSIILISLISGSSLLLKQDMSSCATSSSNLELTKGPLYLKVRLKMPCK